VIRGVDGHDPVAIKTAIEQPRASIRQAHADLLQDRDRFRRSPNKAGKESSHGAPLGKDEIAATRARAGLGTMRRSRSRRHLRRLGARAKPGRCARGRLEALVSATAPRIPELAAELSAHAGELPADFADAAPPASLAKCPGKAGGRLAQGLAEWHRTPSARCCRN
jgi:transketolase